MQLPQKKKTMPPADERPVQEAPSAASVPGATGDTSAAPQCSTEAIKTAGDIFAPRTTGMGQPHAPTMGSALGMPFGSQFSRPDVNAPLPDMPGTESVAEDAPGVDAHSPEAGTPGAALPEETV